MSRQSRWEYLRKVHHRYSKASSRSKQPILDEFRLNGTIINTPLACSTVLLPSRLHRSAANGVCDLWASGDLGAQCHLESGWLTLVSPSEGAAAGVDEGIQDGCHLGDIIA